MGRKQLLHERYRCCAWLGRWLRLLLCGPEGLYQMVRGESDNNSTGICLCKDVTAGFFFRPLMSFRIAVQLPTRFCCMESWGWFGICMGCSVKASVILAMCWLMKRQTSRISVRREGRLTDKHSMPVAVILRWRMLIILL